MSPCLRLGPWERALAIEQRHFNDCCAGWLVQLDREIDAALVSDALEQMRALFPVYFARVLADDRGPGVTVALEPDRPVRNMLRHVENSESGDSQYLRVMVNAPLDPVSDGLMRCHLVDQPASLIGFHWAHVAGDGYSNRRMRTVFADILDALYQGRRPELPAFGTAHDLVIEDLQRILPMNARAMEEVARRRGVRRTPRMSIPVAEGSSATEIRVFQAAVDSTLYAEVVARSSRMNITPLAMLASAFVLAVREAVDPWMESPGDFLGLSVPHDMRRLLGRLAEIGNLSFPQGVPIYADDPRERDALAAVLFDRLTRGRNNRLVYRHFLSSLRQAAHESLSGGMPVPRLSIARDRLVLEPFAAFGVTEVPNRGEVKTIGRARVVRSWFQTPLLTRRFAEGRVLLSCTVNWHPSFDKQLRSMFARMLSLLLDQVDVEWDLL